MFNLINDFPENTAAKVGCLCQDQNPTKKIENLSIKDYSNQNNPLSSFGSLNNNLFNIKFIQVIGDPFDIRQDGIKKN